MEFYGLADLKSEFPECQTPSEGPKSSLEYITTTQGTLYPGIAQIMIRRPKRFLYIELQ
jgi:hypothetical protein